MVFEKNSYISYGTSAMYLAVNKTCPDQSKMFYNSPANMRSLNIEMYVDCLVDNVDFDKKLINTVLGGIEKK